MFVPDYRIGIEYDGVLYHNKEENIERDKKKNKILTENKITLIRIRENGLVSIWKNEFFCQAQRKASFKKCFISVLEFIKKEIKLDKNIIEKINNASELDFDDDIKLIKELHKKTKVSKSLLIKRPDLAAQWHPTKNGDLKPENVTCGSTLKVWWVCDAGHEFLMEINSRNKSFGCPYCSGMKVSIDNCIATKKPELIKEWHPTKNGELTPFDVTFGSNKIVWWLCEKGHEYKMDINKRNKGGGCPYCSSHKLHMDNCLTAKRPDLAAQWHLTKNGDLKPEDFFPSSKNKIWWICEKGHEWQARIVDRHCGNGCPYCDGKKVSKENSLATKRPKLVNKWDYEKNGDLTPETVTVSSGRRVWWKCNICGHRWESNINNMSRGLGRCSKCETNFIN
jgi:hypothetical protein